MCLAVPGQVVEISDAERGLAKVAIGGVQREVNLSLVLEEGEAPEGLLGQWVVVHVGFALSRLSPEEAEETLRLIDALSR